MVPSYRIYRRRSSLGFSYMYDQLRKTTVLFYDFDDQMMTCYQQLHDSGAKLASCSKVWHVEASGAVYDPKYHAGAGNLLRRKATSISKAKPPLLKRILRRLLSKLVVKHCISFQIEYWFLTLMVSALLVMISYSLTLVIVDSLKAKVYLEMP